MSDIGVTCAASQFAAVIITAPCCDFSSSITSLKKCAAPVTVRFSVVMFLLLR